jgi:hypothetical protein
MVEVKPENPKIGNIANFYDPLFKVRYENGPKDLLEIFNKVKTHWPTSTGQPAGAWCEQWYENSVEEWHSSENNKRRLYSIPYRLFKYIDSILESGSLSKMKFNDLIDIEGTRGAYKEFFRKTSVFSYFNPTFKDGYTLLEYLFHRNKVIYIYIDERHWASQRFNAKIIGRDDQAEIEVETGHPYQIARLFIHILSKRPLPYRR